MKRILLKVHGSVIQATCQGYNRVTALLSCMHGTISTDAAKVVDGVQQGTKVCSPTENVNLTDSIVLARCIDEL